MNEIGATSEFFSQAAMLMAVGMGFVFAFLSLLILFIKTVITPLGKRFPDVAEPNTQNNQPINDSPKVIAAITAAVSQYRKKHK